VTMTGELDNTAVAKVYARWARFAPVYDLVFGPVLSQGRRDSIAAAERVGGRILELGVGTGISLGDYSGKHRVVGVDYSEPMLRKAHERVTERKLKHVEALAVMDGTRLAFSDSSFDAVVAQYVITTVPDPEGTLDECVRVTRPGGEIILVNHLGAEAGLRRDFERSFAPMARKLGWQPEFSWTRLEQWMDASGSVRLIERRRMPPLGHFSLIRFERLAVNAHVPVVAAAARLEA
jgi:phosphatidylethanolamine/phosphatidyl-N-methylethanolamine N-methyltransferase